MGLKLAIDLSGLPAVVASAIDDVVAPIQAWAGQVDGAGRWVDVPYDARLYQSVTGTWTVNRDTHRSYRYTVLQDVMFLRVLLQGTTTGAGMGNDLRIRIPDGYELTDTGFVGVAQWNADTAGIDGLGRVFASAGADRTVLRIVRDVLAASTAWPSGETGTFGLRLNVTLPVARVGG